MRSMSVVVKPVFQMSRSIAQGNFIPRPKSVGTLGESLAGALVKGENARAIKKISRAIEELDMREGKQKLNARYRKMTKLIENAYGKRLLHKRSYGEGKKRSTSFLVIEPGTCNYIRLLDLSFKPPRVRHSDERFLFKVTSHALERLLATKSDQKEWLLDVFNDASQLFAPSGRIMSDSLSRQLPSTFHHWVAGKGESRCVVEIEEGGRPVITLKTFILQATLRGWNLAQSSKATSGKNYYQLKRQQCTNV